MINTLYQFLLKLGYTDPIHAPITHVPIGLVIGGLVFILVAIIFRRQNLVFTSRHVMILAFLFAFPTILFGVFDWMHYLNAALITPIKIKMVLAAALLVILGAGIVIGGEGKGRTPAMLGVYAVSFVIVVGLGFYGGKIVYGGLSSLTTTAAPVAMSAGPAVAQAPAGGAAEAGAQPASQQQLQAGGSVFAQNCQACHANGGNIVAPNLPLKKAKQLATYESFLAYIRNPKMPDGSAGAMPPFPSDKVSDQQARDLYASISAMLKDPSWK